MTMNVNLLRTIGRTPSPRIYKTITIGSVGTTAYAVGDVLSSGLITLNCVGLNSSGLFTVHEVRAHQKRATGDAFTAPKLHIRFFNDSTYSPPAQNAVFVPPTNYTLNQGKVTIETTDWEDYNEASGDKHAFAQRHLAESEKATIVTESGTQAIHAVVTIETVVTHSADQQYTIELVIEPH